MTWKECKILIKSDLARLNKIKFGCISYLITNASFKITFWFRIGSYLKQRRSLFFRILYMIVFLIHKHNQYLTGIQLPIGTSIGKGLRFEHFSCIIINPSAIIGANCTIMQGVTIGSERGPKGGVPNIGDNVVISCGSLLIGNINIGNNVMIGAGAVVVKDIPDNAVAIGVPAKVVSFDGREKVLLHIN
jgi:serine O-acetyltransferase